MHVRSFRASRARGRRSFFTRAAGISRAAGFTPAVGTRRLRIEGLESRQLLAVTPLIAEATQVRAIVPTQQQYNDFGLDWTDNGFDDSLWLATDSASPNGVGYDVPPGTPYVSFIDSNTSINAAMSGVSPTAFVRIPFTVADPSAFSRVVLKLRYDDAFIAYINGTEVVRSQTAPAGYPARDVLATGTHDALLAPGNSYAGFDLGKLTGVLHAGTNVLAIRGFNVGLSDDDFLIQAQLEGQTPGAAPVARDDSLQFVKGATAAQRSVNVLLNDSVGENALATAPIRILSQPSHGTLNVNQSTGDVEFVAVAGYAGPDNFVYQLEDATGSAGDNYGLVNDRTAVRAFIPTDATLGATWQQPGFNDGAWIGGTGWVGYDTNGATGGDFTPFVGGPTNPGAPGANTAAMRGANPSVYVRYKFNVDANVLPAIDSLALRMRWDDGFVAYLNGVQIAIRNALANPAFNSTATTNRTDNSPLTAQTITDLLATEARAALKAGENVLAIQGLNVNAGDVDQLLQAEFTARTSIAGARSNPAIVSVQIDSLEPIAVDDSTENGQPIRAGSAIARTINVLANDLPGVATDRGTPPINPATVTISTPPTNGTATANPNGTVTYTSAAGFLGTATFQYTVKDNSQRVTTKLISASTATQGPPVSPGAAGSTPWFYLADGTDQGTAWRATTFNALGAGWSTGRGQFGYGEGDETTTVDCGPAPGNECTPTSNTQTNKYITTYFRTQFDIANLTTLQGLRLRFKRDDGIAIYVNGNEWFRDNLAAGAGFNTPATVDVQNLAEDTFITHTMTAAQRANLVPGTNVIAVEVHQFSASSPDMTFDMEVEVDADTGTARTSNPATVTVQVVGTNPVANPDTAITAQATPVTINVASNDQAGFSAPPLNPNSVAITSQPTNGSVTVGAGGNVIYTPNATFVGTDTFQYTIRDTTPPTAPVMTTVIARGAVWKYLDDGSNQMTAWIQPTFNDMAWKMGPAELGYGDGGEATVIGFGTDPNMKFITSYFRRKFDVTNPSQVQAITINLRRDDGAVVYINGREVGRQEMSLAAPNPVLFNTLGTDGDGDDGVMYFPMAVPAATLVGLLVAGSNTIAVEVHQVLPTSSDVSFDLDLILTEAGVAGVVSNPATVTVNVNARPIADNETVSVGTSQSIIIPVLDGDVDPAQSFGTVGIDPASIVVTGPAAGQGTVTRNADGTLNYQAPTFTNPRQVTFTYTVADLMPGAANARSLPATVTVNVTIQAPMITPDFELTPRGTPIDINPIAREADTQGFFAISNTSIQIASQPAVGSAAVVNTPQGQRIRYTPPAGFTGTTTLNYTIADVNGNRSAPGAVRIEVYEPAVANLDTFPTRTNAPLTLNVGQVMVNDVRVDYQAAVNLLTSFTDQGGTIVQTGNTLTYTPPPGFVGIDSFQYRLIDTQVRTPARSKNPSNFTTVEIAVGAVTVDGFVYVDLNRNGVKDVSESGVPGAMITLTRHAGGVSDRTFSTTHVTNAAGFYSFATTTGLPMVPGTFTVAETPPITFVNNAQVPANTYNRITLVADSQNHDINFRKFGPGASFFPFFLNYGGGFLASQQPVNLAAGSLVVPYTDWDGTFTAQATYAASQGGVDLRLYGGNGSLLSTAGGATAVEGGLSQKTLSYNPAAGQPLVLVMSGTNTYVNASMPSQGEATGDTVAPLVMDVVVGSTRWSQAFIDQLRQSGMGSGGYSVMHAGENLPWSNLDQVTVRFSEDVAISPWDLGLWGTNTLDHLAGGAGIQNFQYDPATFTATWTLTQPIDTDRMRISLSDRVMDGVGNRLGDNMGGGGLDLPVSVVPGDVSRGGATTAASVTEVLRRAMTRIGDERYSIYHDFDGNGRINIADAVAIRNRVGSMLPAGSPTAGSPAAPAALRGVRVIDAAIREISTVAVELESVPPGDAPTPGRLRAVRSAIDLALADVASTTTPTTPLTIRASRSARSARTVTSAVEM